MKISYKKKIITIILIINNNYNYKSNNLNKIYLILKENYNLFKYKISLLIN
jgi:hypothetical protein